MLTVKELSLPEVKLLTPAMHGDERGYLAEVMHEREMASLGLPRFVQENQSLSRDVHIVRGLHCQKSPHAQGKLVRVLAGKIFDVAVDVRPHSKNFGKHASAILDASEGITMMYVPPGFLHGFCVLAPNTIVLYKLSDFYAPGQEAGVMWNDPDLGIDWPVKKDDVILSAKDAKLPSFKDFPQLTW